VPNGPSPGDQTASLAASLVAQLHASPVPKLKPVSSTGAVSHREESPLPSFSALPGRARGVIYVLGALLLLIIVYRTLLTS
jgi:hypothetical protein